MVELERWREEVLRPPCSFASRICHRAGVVEGGEADGELEGDWWCWAEDEPEPIA